MADKIFDYHEETTTERLFRKSEESPFMVVGLIGMFTACGIGAYKYKNRGNMSTSIYLMRLRVAAQGTAVATLTVGMVYQLYTSFMKKRNKTEK